MPRRYVLYIWYGRGGICIPSEWIAYIAMRAYSHDGNARLIGMTIELGAPL
jgi:hypothetical protein